MSRAHERPARIDDVPTPSLHAYAYDQGLRALDDQRDELNGIRTRAVQFVAFVGAASGFLVGSALGSSDADSDLFYVVASIASIASVVMLVCVALVLSPAKKFEYRLDPNVLVQQWIERDVPRRPTQPELLSGLAKLQSGMIQDNETSLNKWRRQYRVLIISGLVSLSLWMAAVWIFA